MQNIPVIVENADGMQAEASIACSDRPPWRISFTSTQAESLYAEPLAFTDDDLFECLVALRKALEAKNWKLLCNGSRPDVYPSRMSRQMGGGRRAYVHKIGEQAKRQDTVDIFDYAAPEVVKNIDEQVLFRQTWFNSLK